MDRQYVAIDLHRKRSLIVREDEHGEELGVVNIDNDPLTLADAVAAGPNPMVSSQSRVMLGVVSSEPSGEA